MPINPITGEEEEEAVLVDQMPSLPQVAPAMNPMVKDYLTKKFNIGQFTPENREKLEQDSKLDLGDKAGAALAALGAGFMGQNAASAGQAKLASAKQEKRQALDDFDKGRAAHVQQYELDKEATADSQRQEKMAREADPNSEESKMARELAVQMGFKGDPTKLTARQFQEFSPAFQKKYEIEQKRLDRQEARDERRFQSGIKMQEKADVRDEKKRTALNEVEDRRRNIEDNLKLVEDMIKENGTYEMFGSHNADLDRRVDMIATDMAKLADPSSVARPSEVEQFKKGLVQSGATGMRNSTALDILKNFRNEIDARTENAYKVRGIENPGSRQQRDGEKQGAKEVERFDKKTGKTAIFDAETKEFLRYK